MFNQDDLQHPSAAEIIEIHDSIIQDDGGLPGARADLSVNGILGRIESNLQYGSFNSIAEVAALYAEAFVMGHVFNDANKRTALVTMLTFLDLNGYNVQADGIALADQMVEIAKKQISQHEMAVWLSGRLIAVPNLAPYVSITCPRCGITIEDPNDIKEGYCGNCHNWT